MAAAELSTPSQDPSRSIMSVDTLVNGEPDVENESAATLYAPRTPLFSPDSKASTTIPLAADDCTEGEAMDTFMNALTAISELTPLESTESTNDEGDLLSPSVLPPIHGSVYAGSICAAVKASKSKSCGSSAPAVPLPTPPNPTRKRKAASQGAESDSASLRYPPMPKVDGEPRFFCRHPGCGKGYASTDAVRKHCRQRHLEWLRALGHGAPSLYCSWVGDDGIIPDDDEADPLV